MSRWIVPPTPSLQRRFLRRRGAFEPSTAFGPGRITTDLFWARNAIFHGLGMVGLAAGQTVLVPAYVCRSVPEAILAYGAAVEFYRVDRDCRLDLEDIERRIRPGVGAVLAVHYFGMPQAQMSALRESCDRRGLFLIEDCAHILPRPDVDDGPGRYGHISVFSWRKFLPVYDGATLSVCRSVARRRAELARSPIGMQLRSTKDVVDRCRATAQAALAGPKNASDILHPVAAPMAECGESRHIDERPVPLAAVDPNGDLFRPDAVTLPMTWTSRAIRNRSDTAAISEIRRCHWRVLLEATRSSPVTQPLFGELAASSCPWIFPLRFTGLQDAHVLLRRRGIPAATWGGVRPASLPSRMHHETDDLYREIVFLPIHQGLTHSCLTAIVSAMQELASG